MTVLTKNNAHRVLTIICIDHPEYGTKRFNYNDQPMNDGALSSFGVGSNSGVLSNSEFHLWAVVSWKEGCEPSEESCINKVDKVDLRILIDTGFLKKSHNSDKWLYKFSINQVSFFTANSKSDAVARATVAYLETPAKKRLTAKEKAKETDNKRLEKLNIQYQNPSEEYLRLRISDCKNKISQLKKSGLREFSKTDSRRTSAAVSNEGARSFGQEVLDLEFLLEYKKVIN